ncbi:CTD small phosphatase-like protein [Actinomyces sp. Chiba101]|nr:CTD small phosphatase-like protein [Actinomyces sp. Chiba101]GAV93953.1 CTD small phosphatase-like protein [Actinomyces denticolens]
MVVVALFTGLIPGSFMGSPKAVRVARGWTWRCHSNALLPRPGPGLVAAITVPAAPCGG